MSSFLITGAARGIGRAVALSLAAAGWEVYAGVGRLEGLTDALRIELRPWGIKVILVEPSSTDTDMWRPALDQLDATESALSQGRRLLHAGHLGRTTKLIQKQAVPLERVVAAVERAPNDPRPKARYPVGLTSRLQLLLNAAAPAPLWDASLARLTGVPLRPPAQTGKLARAGETEA